MPEPPEVESLIRQLGLIPHPEGGYFRETFRSGAPPMRSRGQTDPSGHCVPAYGEQVARNLLTSIYWMPLRSSPIGWLCRNRADHLHYYHAGAALRYHLVTPEGALETHRLGPDSAAGEVMQLIVPGGWWKAAHLEEGDFCLLGEAVAPGFDFADFDFISEQQLRDEHPRHADDLMRFVKPDRRRDFDRYYTADDR